MPLDHYEEKIGTAFYQMTKFRPIWKWDAFMHAGLSKGRKIVVLPSANMG
jgi:hypothetical protein